MLSFFHKKLRERKPRLILEQLEERIVLDASVAPVHHDHSVDSYHGAYHASDPHVAADTAALGQPWQGQSVGSAHPLLQGDYGHHGSHHDGSTGSNPLSQSFEQGLDVMVVASNVQDPQAIENAATPGTDVILYDGTQATLSTIDASLAKLVATSGEKIEHLSIVSYGEPGIVSISQADGWSVYNLQINPTPWTALGKLLTTGAEIDFYGCNIGQGQGGVQLVQDIAHLTGATVWASDHVVGSGAGESWTLDVHSGQSSLPSLLDVSKLTNSGIQLDDTVIANGDFEQGYTDWTLVNTTPFTNTLTGISPYPWLSAWGLDTNGTPLQQGFLTKLDDLNPNVGHSGYTNHFYTDYTNQSNPYTTVPLLYTGNLGASAGVTATEPTYTGNIAFAAQTYTADMEMYQVVTLPTGAKTLSWDMSYSNYAVSGFTDSATAPSQQYLSVSIIDLTNPALSEILVLTANSQTNNSVQALQYLTVQQTNMTNYSFDVSQFGGDTVRIEVDIKAERGVLPAAFDNFNVSVLNQPVAYTQTVQAFENTPLLIALGGTDSNPGAGLSLTYYVDSLPASGTLYADAGLTTPIQVGQALGSNQVYYESALNDYSNTSFSFHVTDSAGTKNATSADATLSIQGNVVNGTPVASPITVSASGDIIVTLTGSDSGAPDPAKVSFDLTGYAPETAGTTPNGGTLAPYGHVIETSPGNYAQQWIYTPPANGGTDSITYTFITPDGAWQGFGPGQNIGTSPQTGIGFDLAVADLNHDGLPDIIICNGDWAGTSGYASYFYLANPSGGYFPGVQIGNTTPTMAAIAIGDLVGTGYTDLVARCENSTMIYMWDPAINSFDPGMALSQNDGGSFGSVAIADLYGNGHNDIVVATNSAPDIFIYKNTYENGTWGHFDTAPIVINTTAYGSDSTVVVGDATGNGQPDIVIGKTNANDIVLLNDGYGNFSTSDMIVLPTPPGGNTNVQYMAIGDVVGNGHPDIVAANDTGGPDVYYQNDGNGQFTAFDIGPGGSNSVNGGGIRLVDLNHDGALDVVAGNYNGSASEYFLFDKATGQYDLPGVKFVSSTGGAVTSFGIAVGDLNGDGFADVVAASDNGAYDQVFYNLGFANQVSSPVAITISEPSSGGSMSSSAAVGTLAMSSTPVGTDTIVTAASTPVDAGVGVISGTGSGTDLITTIATDPLATVDPLLTV